MTRAWLTTAFVLMLTETAAFGCWQTEQVPVLLHATSLNALVIDHDKPKKGAKFELRQAITFDREEAKLTGAYNQNSLRAATTDSLGVFSFGEVRQGRYWIVPAGARSLHDPIAVEVKSPDNKKGARERLKINYFADGCRDLTIDKGNR